MGKKGSWFSAIKRVFSPSSKERVADGTGNKDLKDKKKKGVGKLKHGDGHSFIPRFREPSSIEKILGEAEREHHITNYKPQTPFEQPRAPPYTTPPPPHPPLRTATLNTDGSPRASSSRRTYSTPRVTSPPPYLVASPPWVATAVNVNVTIPTRVPSLRFVQRHRPEPTLKYRHNCAAKIQAAFRGYTARRSYRTLRGLVRLQGVMKGQSVKRQTENALKSMQLMVHVQNQIHSRRIQMLENQALKNNNKDGGNWNSSENTDEWDYSRLTKEEIEARMKRKVDAMSKRERAMAYAYSHQLWKSSPKMAQAALADIRSRGYPYWWNWQEQRHAPPRSISLANHSQSPAIKTPNFTPTATRPNLRFKASPSPVPSSNNLGQLGLRFDNMDTSTPTSTKSAVPSRPNLARTPPGRVQQKFNHDSPFNGAALVTFKDDDSLMSCPHFSVPRYMSPTMSAKAKVRIGKEQVLDSPSSMVDESKRRVTFPFGQAFGSFKWKNKESGSQKGSGGKNQPMQTLGDHLNVEPTISKPATVGRKAFNRYV